MTKRKFLFFVSMLMLIFTLNITKAFAWFTTSDSINLSVTTGTWVRPYLVSGEEFNRITSPVKRDIKTVEFLSTIPDLTNYKMGINKFDVSKEQDGSVMAWVENGTDMFIGGIGGIIADQSLNTMFSYYTSVESVTFNKVLDTKDSTSAYSMFLSCEKLLTTDINNLDTGNIKYFQLMFANCINMRDLDITSWDVKSAENMSNMFANDKALHQVKLGTKHAEKVQTFENMFKDCGNLSFLDFSHFYTRDAVNYKGMFKDNRVVELDLSGFKMRADANLSQMFGYMGALKTVYVSENWSDIVKTDCLPFWMCTGLTGSNVSEQEGIDMANYETGYFKFKQMEAK